ncbi:MAG: tetratricopeptide repeat protein [Polyangia bacterium]
MRILLAVLAVAASLSISGPVAAQDVKAEAKAAFEQGKAAFEQGDYERAAAAFRRANELRPNWRLLYNIAQSEAAAKNPGLALQAFEAYLAQGGDDVVLERRDECVAEIERLKAMVGEIEVFAPAGAIVFVDGAERERTPLPGPMMVSAGVEHQVRIEHEGEVILDRKVRVSSGKRVTVEIESGHPAASAPVAEKAAEPDDGSSRETSPLVIGGWVALGVGAGALIGGGSTGGMVLSLDDELAEKCDGEVCTSAKSDDVDKLDNLALTTDVLIGVGAAAAITGVVLLIIGYGDEEHPASEVAVTPLLGPGVAGAGIQGRF